MAFIAVLWLLVLNSWEAVSSNNVRYAVILSGATSGLELEGLLQVA